MSEDEPDQTGRMTIDLPGGWKPYGTQTVTFTEGEGL